MYGAEINRLPRQKVLVRARMRVGAAESDVCIRDMSARGMLVQANAPPGRGTLVVIDCEGWPVPGQVIWCGDRRFGIQTRDTLDVDWFLERLNRLDAKWEAPAAPRVRAGAPRPRSHAESRATSRTLQFATIVGACAAGAAAIALTLHSQLSGAFLNAAAGL